MCVCILSLPFNRFVFVTNFQFRAKTKHFWVNRQNIPSAHTLAIRNMIKKGTFPFYFFCPSKIFRWSLFKTNSWCWNLWFLPSTCSVCREAFGLNSLEFLSLILFHPLLPVLSPFWQHVLSPPIVKSSKRIKHFIPQHQTFYPESLARLKSKPRRNRKQNSGKKNIGNQVKVSNIGKCDFMTLPSDQSLISRDFEAEMKQFLRICDKSRMYPLFKDKSTTALFLEISSCSWPRYYQDSKFLFPDLFLAKLFQFHLTLDVWNQ